MAEYTDDIEASLDAAEVMLSEGQTEQAMVLLEKLAAAYPDSPDVACLLGDADFDMGDLERAIECYDRAVDLDPGWTGAYSARANCLLEVGRIDEAQEDVEEALKLDSRNAEAHYVRAMALELKGHQRQSDDAYKTAAALAPDSFYLPVRVSRKVFDKAVRQAIRNLPPRFKERMDGVDIYVKDLPGPEDNPDAPFAPLIMGAFDGFSIKERRGGDPWTQFPPRIYLYQKNIERVCGTREELIEEIEITLLHEVGHFFGLEDEDLEKIDLG